MFGFISEFFHKVAALVTSVLVAVGLVSAPVPAPIDLPAYESAETAILAEQFKEPEVPEPAKPEVKAVVAPKPVPVPTPPPAPIVPAVPKIQKLTLPSGIVVEVDEKGQMIGQSGSVAQPVSAPVAPPSSSQSPLPAGFFRMPSGLIVDQNGNIVTQ